MKKNTKRTSAKSATPLLADPLGGRFSIVCQTYYTIFFHSCQERIAFYRKSAVSKKISTQIAPPHSAPEAKSAAFCFFEHPNPSPESSDYAPSCLGEGEDGNLYYDGFVVYTYRENGTETVEYVE